MAVVHHFPYTVHKQFFIGGIIGFRIGGLFPEQYFIREKSFPDWRSRFFTSPSLVFMSQGTFQTYSMIRWSAKGTLASSPEYMLVRSMRLRRVCMNQRRFNQAISRRLASSGESSSRTRGLCHGSAHRCPAHTGPCPDTLRSCRPTGLFWGPGPWSTGRYGLQNIPFMELEGSRRIFRRRIPRSGPPCCVP